MRQKQHCFRRTNTLQSTVQSSHCTTITAHSWLIDKSTLCSYAPIQTVRQNVKVLNILCY